jgi:hypothetical protein
LFINTLWPPRFQARERPPRSTNAVFGRRLVIRRTNEGVAAWTRPLGKSSRNHPSKKIIWPGQVLFSDRVSGKDAWYEGAGIDRGGVSARLGGAYYVDDAEIGKPGSCEIESWSSFAANGDRIAVFSPACVLNLGRPVELGTNIVNYARTLKATRSLR